MSKIERGGNIRKSLFKQFTKLFSNKQSSATLTEKEIKKLEELGKKITAGLSCDINGQGIPCRTDRFASVYSMIEYLQIHHFIFFQEELIDFYKPRTLEESRELYLKMNINNRKDK